MRTFTTIITLLLFKISYSQYSKGLVFNDDMYEATPLKARLTLKSYKTLPQSYSLKKYAPEVRNQGSYGTCVGWASAWAARTILYAKNKSLNNKYSITKNAFSPAYIYHYSRAYPNEKTCKNGAYINTALNIMKNKGVPKYNNMSVQCTKKIPYRADAEAKAFKIKDYNRVFDQNTSIKDKINLIKTSLSNGFPVVIGAICPPSLFIAKDVWIPTELPEKKYGGHAMCVVSYNNNKYGGAFEVMNSWGKSWGNNGFCWVKYNDFHRFVKYGFEVYPVEMNKSYKYEFSGKVIFRSNSADKLDIKKTINKGQTTEYDTDSGIADYRLSKPLYSGSKYKVYVSNDKPAYMYVIASDLKNNASILFPFNQNISAYMSYSKNEIVLPNENYSFKLDNNKGIDYTCVLFSKYKLDINKILRQIKSASGNFKEKLNKVIGDKLISNNEVKFSSVQASFSARSHLKSVVAIIVEIEHK